MVLIFIISINIEFHTCMIQRIHLFFYFVIKSHTFPVIILGALPLRRISPFFLLSIYCECDLWNTVYCYWSCSHICSCPWEDLHSTIFVLCELQSIPSISGSDCWFAYFLMFCTINCASRYEVLVL